MSKIAGAEKRKGISARVGTVARRDIAEERFFFDRLGTGKGTSTYQSVIDDSTLWVTLQIELPGPGNVYCGVARTSARCHLLRCSLGRINTDRTCDGGTCSPY